jgi:hypothetical protein
MKPGVDDSANIKAHHAVGLISFGRAIVAGGGTLLLLIVALISDGGTCPGERLHKILFVQALVIAPILYATGLVLGIVGAFFKKSKKVFPVLGIIFNALPLVAAILIWIFFLVIIMAVLSSGGGRH